MMRVIRLQQAVLCESVVTHCSFRLLGNQVGNVLLQQDPACLHVGLECIEMSCAIHHLALILVRVHGDRPTSSNKRCPRSAGMSRGH